MLWHLAWDIQLNEMCQVIQTALKMIIIFGPHNQTVLEIT